MDSMAWCDANAPEDFTSAADSLACVTDPKLGRKFVAALRTAPISTLLARHVLRACGLKLLPDDHPRVEELIHKAKDGKEMTPLLLIRGDVTTGRQGYLCDGLHRLCGAIHMDYEARVAARCVGIADVLSGDKDEAARQAFASGYAEVREGTLPMPPHVRAACDAAIETAREHGHSDAVLQMVREAGRREALLVSLGRKREALAAFWCRQLDPVLVDVAALVAPAIAGALAAKPKPTEAVAPQSPDPSGAIQRALELIVGTDVWESWTQFTREAWVEAVATGNVIGQSLLADARGEVIPSFDHAFQAAIDALGNLGAEWDSAETWMGRMTHGLGVELGRKVGDAIAQGADYRDLLSVVSDTITADESGADLMLGYMLSEGAVEGSRSTYADAGVELEDVLISGNACDECESAQMQNPWPRGDAPIPNHPNCRCDVAPHL